MPPCLLVKNADKGFSTDGKKAIWYFSQYETVEDMGVFEKEQKRNNNNNPQGQRRNEKSGVTNIQIVCIVYFVCSIMIYIAIAENVKSMFDLETEWMDFDENLERFALTAQLFHTTNSTTFSVCQDSKCSKFMEAYNHAMKKMVILFHFDCFFLVNLELLLFGFQGKVPVILGKESVESFIRCETVLLNASQEFNITTKQYKSCMEDDALTKSGKCLVVFKYEIFFYQLIK